jgi:hypothetical protein
MKEDDVKGGACSTHESEDKYTNIFRWKTLKDQKI